MVTSVISQPTSVTMEFNVVAKIYKYRQIHEGYHFIPMAMEVHGTLGCDMDYFIRESIRLFHDRQLRGHLSLFFYSIFQAMC